MCGSFDFGRARIQYSVPQLLVGLCLYIPLLKLLSFFRIPHTHLTLDDEGEMFIRNVRNHLSSDAVLTSQKQESSITPLYKSQRAKYILTVETNLKKK
jgi:hypothetical protein